MQSYIVKRLHMVVDIDGEFNIFINLQKEFDLFLCLMTRKTNCRGGGFYMIQLIN